jgi:hypothetical protein
VICANFFPCAEDLHHCLPVEKSPRRLFLNRRDLWMSSLRKPREAERELNRHSDTLVPLEVRGGRRRAKA